MKSPTSTKISKNNPKISWMNRTEPKKINQPPKNPSINQEHAKNSKDDS